MTLQVTRNDQRTYGLFHNWRVWVLALGRWEVRVWSVFEVRGDER